MRNAKKTLSLVMVAIFTTFIVLSGIPAGAVTTAQAKAQVTKATAAVVKAEAAVKSASFNPTTAQTINTAATKEVAKVNALGKTYKSTYVKLVARYQAVNKKIAARKLAIINAAKKVYTDAEKAVTAAENATDGDKVDLVGDETALANAQSAVTTALEMIVKLNQESSDYKGLMARIDAANNLIVKAMDEIAAAAAEKAAADAAAAKAAEAAKVLAAAIEAAEKDVAALEAAPLTTLAEIDAAVVLGTKAAATVKTVTDTEKAAAFAARIKAVADKGIAAKATIDAKAAAEAEAKKPATIVSVSAVDGTITVTFNKKPLTTPTAVDFVVTKTVTTTSAVTTTLTPTSVAVVSDTAVTLVVPAVVSIVGVDQSVVYSVVYNATGAAVVAPAVTVAKTPGLEVKSVVVNNLKNVVITFNKAFDDTTVTVDTVKLYLKGSATADTYSKLVSTDKTVLTLAYSAGAAMNQNDTVKVVIDGVKDAAAVAMTAYDKTFNVKDVADPAYSSVTVVNNKQMKVYFTEPVNMDTVGVYKTTDVATSGVLLKVDGVITFAKFTPSLAGNYITVDFFNKLADGTHTITLSGVKDYTGFVAADITFTIQTAADVIAPAVKEVKFVSPTRVNVIFTEPVTASGTFNVYEAGNAVDLMVAGSKAVNADDATIMELTLGTSFTAASIVGFDVKYASVQDTSGNASSSTAQTVSGKTPDDLVKPAVTATEVLTGNVIKVAFNEKVKTLTSANFVLYKADGTTIAQSTATGIADYDTTTPDGMTFKVTFATLTNIDAATYVMKVTGVKDLSIRANTITDATFSLVAKDSKAPTIAASVVVPDAGANDKIEVVFSEAMDTTSLNTLANYFIGTGSITTPLSSVTDAKVYSVSADGKKVVLVVPNADGLGTNRLAAPGLKDLAANPLGNASIGSPFTVAGAYVAMTDADITVKATAVNKIVVTAKNGYTFSAATPSDFKLIKTATPATPYDLGIVAAQPSTDGTAVTLTTSVSMTSDAKYLTTGIDLYVAAGTTKDMNGTVVAIAAADAVNITDGIGATQATPTVQAAPNNNKIDVTFDEPIIAASAGITNAVLATAFTVKVGTTVLVPNVDYTAAIAASTATLTVVKDGVAAADVNVQLIHPEYLTDAVGNAVSAIAATTVTGVSEKVAPVAPTAAIDVTGKVVTLTFGEVLDPTTVILANITGTAGAPSVSYTAGGKTVTLTYTVAPAPLSTIIVGVGIKDLAGNALAAPVTLTQGTDF